MFKKKAEPAKRPEVKALEKALWYAEKGLTHKARIATKEALVVLKAADNIKD